MDFYDVIRKRRSVRAYRREPIEEDKLRRVLKAARAAPTAEPVPTSRKPLDELVEYR